MPRKGGSRSRGPQPFARRRRGGRASNNVSGGPLDQPSRQVHRQLATVPPASRILRGSLVLNAGPLNDDTNVTIGSISTVLEDILTGSCGNWYLRIKKITAFGLPKSDGTGANALPYCMLRAYNLSYEDYGSLAFVANVGIIPPMQERDRWILRTTSDATIVATGIADLVQVSIELVSSQSVLPSGEHNPPAIITIVPCDQCEGRRPGGFCG
jgi:hypothetical protein